MDTTGRVSSPSSPGSPRTGCTRKGKIRSQKVFLITFTHIISSSYLCLVTLGQGSSAGNPGNERPDSVHVFTAISFTNNSTKMYFRSILDDSKLQCENSRQFGSIYLRRRDKHYRCHPTEQSINVTDSLPRGPSKGSDKQLLHSLTD